MGLLFECAPDASIRRRHPDAIDLPQLIGDFDAIKRRAHTLARKLLQDEPKICGLQQLGVFEELVVRELQHVLHAKELHDGLIQKGFRACVFAGESRLAKDLRWIACRAGSHLKIVAPFAADAGVSSLRRSWQRLRGHGFSRSAFEREWRQVMERVDPFHRRARFVRSKGGPRHALWFYSTAYTFTRIGQLYEPYFPKAFKYLIEDPLTGGVPLKLENRPFISPYQFSSLELAPSRREIADARERIVSHLRAVELSAGDAVARDAYLESVGLATFVDRLLQAGLFQTRLFGRFVELMEPAALIVGNPVFEGYALHAAREAGVPSLLLQHGILGDYCQFVDPPVDHYIVRGEFWREFLAPAARARSVVLNPPATTNFVEIAGYSRRAIVFITAPYELQEYWSKTELDEILNELLGACGQERADLIIRVHPLEETSVYRSIIERLNKEGGLGVSVTYSQGGNLDEVLRAASVAVMFSSTSFLDCLRYKVPVVALGWHDFSYKHLVHQYGVFEYCKDLAALRGLILDGLRGELHASSCCSELFLANTSPTKIRATIEDVLKAS